MAKMKSVLLLSFLLFVFVSSCCCSSSNDEFNIYQLVLLWNPAACSDTNLTSRCALLPNNLFTISGLWPTLTTPFNIPGPCSGSQFNRENIEPLVPMLNRNWPNVITGRPESRLWSEEWRKHGTCSEDYLDQFDYFSLALNTNARHNILNILNTNGIRANESTYRRDDVQAAINRAIGVRPALRCNRNYLSKTVQLHEVVLCLNKDDESLINCISSSRFNTCPSRFEWFPWMRTYQGHFFHLRHWQPATCNNTGFQACSRPAQNRFSIDGVWPISRANRVLGPCEGANFDANQISFIRSRLDQDWPDVINRRNQELWRNEWRNHGTCSDNDFGQLQYFSFALSTFDGNNIENILRRNNIAPDFRRVYRRADIEDIIQRNTRSRPYITCNFRRHGGASRSQLYQVILCTNEFGNAPINCPLPAPPVLRSCPDSIYWFPV